GAGLFAARTASALCGTSYNDIDCPNPACGGDVCQWPAVTCVTAGTDAKGLDGWCMMDSDCKCKAQGATCNLSNYHCTFTKPSDAPGGGATGGASGSTGGASGTGGAAAGTGGASTGNDGGTKPASGDSGGCSVGGAASSTGLGAMLGLAALLISRRRRGRA
ncbi:MAG: MYXO-CTERM sorting domain-containing protein, partial [Myxococcales bacterium]